MGVLMLLRRMAVVAIALAVAVPTGPAAFAAPPAESNIINQNPPRPDRSPGSHEPDFDPHAVLVQFKPGASAAATDRAVKSRNAQMAGAVAGTRFVRVTGQAAAPDLLHALSQDPAVAAVSLDYKRRASKVPNDPLYVSNQVAYLHEIQLDSAWNRSIGSTDQVIAVIDSGVDGTHPDLAGRVLAGYNAITNTGTAVGANSDDNGHGTMVSGVAAANTDNGIGIAGVAWNARVMPVKVLDSAGTGNDSDIAEGITWAADHGAKIINLSLGGPGDSAVLHDAVTYATNKGAILVVAAGNTGDGTVQYPAAYPEVLAVAATDSSARISDFSTRGDWVDVAAPGFRIVSTGPNHNYYFASGTSFAAPMVSGVAALMRANNPALTPAQLTATIRAKAQEAGPRGLDPYYGTGVLDASASVGGVIHGGSFPVFPLGANEPNDVPARATAFTNSVTGTIAVEGDVDWYRFDNATARSVAVRVTPPAYDSAWSRNLDPVVEVYDQDLRLVGAADDGAAGDPENVNLSLGVGAYYVAVRNYNGSADDFRTYTLAVVAATASAATPGAPVAVRSTGIADFATGVALDAKPTVTFGRTVDPATVKLLHGVTGQVVPTTTAFDAGTNTATLTPAAALQDNTPYRLVVEGLFTSTFKTVDTAPAPVTNLQADSATGVVSWTAPAITDLKRVIVRSMAGPTGGTSLYAGTGTSFTPANLKPGTAYTLQAFTEDNSGKITDGPSVSLTVNAYKLKVDFNGDGNTDVAGIDANSDIKLYAGDGTGKLDGFDDYMWPAGGLWGGFKHVVAADFDGDGKVDIAGIDANNDIKLYTGDGAGKLVGSGSYMWPTGGLWGGFKKIVAGDFNGDGKVDIAGIDANSDLKVYSGDGTGKLTGTGSAMWPLGGLWSGFKHIEAADFNNDGKTDIAGIDANNDIKVYFGDGAAKLTGVEMAMWPLGGLWAGFKHIVAGDFNNDGNADIAGIDANNDIKYYTGNGAGKLVGNGFGMWPTGGLWVGFKHLT
ncbi:S8 family serine peptidase [Dactylosporangium matsuzakiense]|nr:S8 family serine peptidase [Dactylosporangium matsuzakiense]UWZ44564.1 S8 family serine peptidase [Dactylosporangium matsuzakiense]